MPNDSRHFLDAKNRDAAAVIEGSIYGPHLLDYPASSWRRKMRSNRVYRCYGTLRYILQIARAKFQEEPTLSLQITSAVLAFVDNVVDAPSAVHLVGIRGLARKEHANALRLTGDLREALKNAKTAIDVYSEHFALEFEAAQAQLVAAQILHEMGEHDDAMKLTLAAQETFDRYDQPTYRLMARMTEGVIFCGRKQFKKALEIFRDVVQTAETQQDIGMLARGLHNAADAARQLGDIKTARELYPRVIDYFTDLNLVTELPRVTWSYALTLIEDGKFEYAISEIYKVRALYLHLGMNLDAATAELEVVRIKFMSGEDVIEACSRLVESFTKAGASQNALEAFAYVREQAASGRLTLAKIEKVRTFANQLAKRPNLLFLPPPEEL